MLFGIVFCVAVMVVPAVCIAARPENPHKDIIIYVGTKKD